ncbi:MAG: Putative S1B family peptidase [Anaerolinea thermophila]|uniref:Putative S1B family peptidase n=1 Tax=Anaerolinea thermophila TaxID=167964 RepID=A0A101FYA3_9CHLR|nr:MAG: Putative S1B family peptidase [Anaerolinea thermophila]
MLKRQNIVFTVIIIFALFLGACTTVTTQPNTEPTQARSLDQEEQNNLPAQVIEYSGGEDALVDIYQRVNPGIVSVIVYTADGNVGQGSGFVYDLEGHIITNYHVVEDAQEIEVTFPEGTRARATVIGEDVDSDIAVIFVDVDQNVLHPLALGNSSDLEVGQFVIAIGNPYGYSGTMTTGIISARGRILDSLRSTQTGSNYAAGDLLQTDAAINPGNSGGPLLDLNGNVIGINRAIYADSSSVLVGSASYSGIGFAIPIDIVKKVVPFLITDGSYDYPFLGISSQDGLTMKEVEAMGFDPSIQGVYVLGVTSGGPAARAGLKAGTRSTEYEGLYAGGDMILALDGNPVENFNGLLTYLFMNKAPGDQITLTILRNGTEKDVVVTLGTRR